MSGAAEYQRRPPVTIAFVDADMLDVYSDENGTVISFGDVIRLGVPTLLEQRDALAMVYAMGEKLMEKAWAANAELEARQGVQLTWAAQAQADESLRLVKDLADDDFDQGPF